MKEKVTVKKTKAKKFLKPLDLQIRDSTILLKAGIVLSGFDVYEKEKNLLIPQFALTYKGDKLVSTEIAIIPSDYTFPIYIVYDYVTEEVVVSELMRYIVLASISYDGEKYYGWRF